jgi:hypothetical protein
MDTVTKKEGEDRLEKVAAECIDLIMLRSKERMWAYRGKAGPEQNAYMELSIAAAEAIRAFVDFDKSMQ